MSDHAPLYATPIVNNQVAIRREIKLCDQDHLRTFPTGLALVSLALAMFLDLIRQLYLIKFVIILSNL